MTTETDCIVTGFCYSVLEAGNFIQSPTAALEKPKRIAFVVPVGYGRNVPRTIRVKYQGVCQCRT